MFRDKRDLIQVYKIEETNFNYDQFQLLVISILLVDFKKE